MLVRLRSFLHFLGRGRGGEGLHDNVEHVIVNKSLIKGNHVGVGKRGQELGLVDCAGELVLLSSG